MKWLFIIYLWLFYYNLAVTQHSSTTASKDIVMKQKLPLIWFGSFIYDELGKVQILKTKQPNPQSLLPRINALDIFLIKAIQDGKLTIYHDSLCSKPFSTEEYKKLQFRAEQETCFQKQAIEKNDYTNIEYFPRITLIDHLFFYDSLKAQFFFEAQALGFYYYDIVPDSSSCGFSCDKSALKVFWLPISNTKMNLKNNSNITFVKRFFFDFNIYNYTYPFYEEVYNMSHTDIDNMLNINNLQNKMNLKECLMHQAATLSKRADSLILYSDIWLNQMVPYKQKQNLTMEWIPSNIYEEQQLDGSYKAIETEAHFVPVNFNDMLLAFGLDFYWNHEVGKLSLRLHAQGMRKEVYDENGNLIQKKTWYYILTKN